MANNNMPMARLLVCNMLGPMPKPYPKNTNPPIIDCIHRWTIEDNGGDVIIKFKTNHVFVIHEPGPGTINCLRTRVFPWPQMLDRHA